MKFKKGNNRIVIVFDSVVIKIPRVCVWKAIKRFWWFVRHGNFSKRLKMEHYESELSLSWLLFKGIIDNWKEFKLYRRTKMEFLMPTYFSLFGLLNIQKSGRTPKIERNDFLNQLENITNKEVYCDPHTFSNPDNFCKVNGHLKIADYGGSRMQSVLKKYGDKLYNEFDFTYKG